MQVLNASFTTRKTRIWLYGSDEQFALQLEAIGSKSLRSDFSTASAALEAFAELVRGMEPNQGAKAANSEAKSAAQAKRDAGDKPEQPMLLPGPWPNRESPGRPALGIVHAPKMDAEIEDGRKPSKIAAKLVDILSSHNIAWPGGRYNAKVVRINRCGRGGKNESKFAWKLEPINPSGAYPVFGARIGATEIAYAGSATIDRVDDVETGIEFELKIH